MAEEPVRCEWCGKALPDSGAIFEYAGRRYGRCSACDHDLVGSADDRPAPSVYDRERPRRRKDLPGQMKLWED